MTCPNCGFSIVKWLDQNSNIYTEVHNCPACGYRLPSPVSVDRQTESDRPRKEYKSIVE